MKFCTKCGFKLEDHYLVCPNCGCAVEEPAKAAPVSQPAPQPVPQPAPQPVPQPVPQPYAAPSRTAPAAAADLPDQYKPLSPWAYFGLNLLFAVPIVGFIFLIVFSFKKTNINRRNYARSFFCALLIAAAVFITFLLVMLVLGKSTGFLERLQYQIEHLF